MTTTCLLPEFSLQQATELVAKLFRLGGTLQPLNGERDLNFLVDSETGKFVFKIANQNESPAKYQKRKALLVFTLATRTPSIAKEQQLQ